MTSMPLFDLLISRERATTVDTSSPASEWGQVAVRELLAEYDRIRAVDDEAGRVRGKTGVFDRELALVLQDAFEKWCYKADAILTRVARLQASGIHLEGATELRDRHRRTMAMLSVTLDEIEAAREQVRRGEVHSMEELRRELYSSRV